MKKKNNNTLVVVLSVLLGVFVVLSVLLGVVAFTKYEETTLKCMDRVEDEEEVNEDVGDVISLDVDNPNVIDLFNMAHGSLGMGNDWAMFKEGKTLASDMDYDYKLYVASSIYGNAVIDFTNTVTNQYRLELSEAPIKNAVNLVFGEGNYKKIDRVPYLCGVLFWDNTKNIYYSDNLGCGGRLGMNSSEIIIKAEKFDDRVEITSAVGYSFVEDTIYKHYDFKEKVSDKINVSIDELEAFVRNNPNKFYNYKYTFKLNDNGFYNYYSIERVN